MPQVSISASQPDFDAAIERLRRGPADVRKAAKQSVRGSASRTTRLMRARVMGLSSSAAGDGGGSKRRRAFQEHRFGGSVRNGPGLRASIAAGVKSTVKDDGLTLDIRVDGSFLPGSQQRLLTYTDTGERFRHPVMGDRKVWVSQSFKPAGWFTKTLREETPRIRADLDRKVSEALLKMQHG